MMIEEIRRHLTDGIIPFWKNLRDDEFGGYYGWMDFEMKVDRKAIKGCILHGRILWFFSNAYMLLKDESLLQVAKHAYKFIRNSCLDREDGGIFWSLAYDGAVVDSTKHTYCQAFAIYALASYYDACKDPEALELALEMFELIEEKCTDEYGYLEAFDRHFKPVDNDKLSENGVIAHKTMNTLLHVFEAYTELYRVARDGRVRERLRFILDVFAEKVYNPDLKRQEVFFDRKMASILDLHSYGHDIETAWLIDRGCEVLDEPSYTEKLSPITKALTGKIYERAYVDHSLLNECEHGVDDTDRIWWVQAEALVGFLNGYEKDRSKDEYLEAAGSIWQYIKTHIIDTRNGSEWFWKVDANGVPDHNKPLVEPWKCPYHNGRMCMEVIRRNINAAS